MLNADNKQIGAQHDSEFDDLQLESNEQEELEARKILTKRRRRVGKIEDVNIDIDALFASKKRFKPDDSTTESSSTPRISSTEDMQLKQAKLSF